MAMKKIFHNSLLLFTLYAELSFAGTDTWSGTTTTAGTVVNMNVAANWTGYTPPTPPSANDSLMFPTGSSSSAAYLVANDLGTAFPISNITISATANSYTLSAVGTNSFSINAGSTLISAGQHEISMPIVLQGLWSISSSSSPLTISGLISAPALTGSIVLTQGQLILSGSNTYSGLGGVTINSNAASPAILSVVQETSIPSDVINNGTLIFAPAAQTTASFGNTISGSGLVQMNGAGIWNLTSPNTYSGGTSISKGTLGISSAANLGSGTLSLGAGALKLNTAGPFAFPITLTGAGTLSTVTTINPTLSGVISESSAGVGSLTTDAGTSTITLSGINSYTGGTIVKSGTLSIAQQSNVGTGSLTLGAATPTVSILTTSQAINPLAIPITLQGPATIQMNYDLTLTKPIVGSGPLTVGGGSSGTTLTLSSVGGANTYTAGTIISSGTVVGDTSSLVGPYTINPATNLNFDQSISGKLIPTGTYAGIITGSGNLNQVGLGTVVISGASDTFTGQATVSAGTLGVTGSLKGAAIAVSSGGTLSGSGIVGPVTSTGGIIGPNGLNKFTVTGAMDFTDGTSTYSVEIAPDKISDLLNVTGTATLGNAKLVVDPDPGFYGFGSSYTILKAGSIGAIDNFATPTSTDSNFRFFTSKSADGNTILLNLVVIEPFLGFPASNRNTQSVVNYFNALGAAGVLENNAALVNVINSLSGQSFAVINDALDQLQPAALSAFGELQADVGGHLISLFHRRPGTTSCRNNWRVWAEPYGNWLEEENTKMQKGFHAQSFGGAMGIDREIFQNFVIGVGGAYNHSDLTWKNNRGHAESNGYYGAAYADYTYQCLYVGGALLAGVDHYHTNRHIQFTTIEETAIGRHDAFDLIAQLSTGLFFGPSACCVFPYLNVDYFLLNQGSFTEKGAPGLNLSVNSFSSQTIRTEIGIGMQVKDTNPAQNMCLSPRVAIGWTMETPVYREAITSSLENETLTFKVKGWDYTWQLLSFTLGLDFSYKCFTIGGEYTGEINGNDKFWSQQANANFSWHW